MDAQIITPESEERTQKALTVLDTVRSILIITVDDYKIAQTAMKEIKDRIKELEEIRMGQTRPIDQAKARIMDFFRGPLQKLEDAKSYLNRIMVKWTEEQEARRKEQERRLQEEARKRAEEEALQAALEAETNGEKQEAEAIIAEPVYVPPVKVNSFVPKSKESHIRETWSAELISLADLVRGIAEGKAPLMAVKADMVFLNEQARSYKQALKIAGVRPVSKKTQI